MAANVDSSTIIGCQMVLQISLITSIDTTSVTICIILNPAGLINLKTLFSPCQHKGILIVDQFTFSKQ